MASFLGVAGGLSAPLACGSPHEDMQGQKMSGDSGQAFQGGVGFGGFVFAGFEVGSGLVCHVFGAEGGERGGVRFEIGQ